MELRNSKRLLYTANFASKQLTQSEKERRETAPGGTVRKLAYLRALNPTSSDLDKLAARTKGAASGQSDRLPDFKRLLAASIQIAAQQPIQRGIVRDMYNISDRTLLEFSKELSSLQDDPSRTHMLQDLYENELKVHPWGKLFLERLEMYPAGVERGELVFTVAMAPGETVTVSHKEWSTSSHEFQDIVQDYFESYSEKGVTEKTDASMSTENQAKHASSVNFGASLSGGYGPVSMTTTLGLTNSAEESNSIKNSITRNREVTEKSSARARQEHKVSVKLETKKGVEDSSFRTITNPGTTARRIDYYRLMRKWRTELFRYDLRMTYDITIPAPGARLWARYRRIAELDTLINTPFSPLEPYKVLASAQELDEQNWDKAANAVGALSAVEPPPLEYLPDLHLHKELPIFSEGTTLYESFEFEVPPGYVLHDAHFVADCVPQWHEAHVKFQVLDSTMDDADQSNEPPFRREVHMDSLKGKTGKLSITYKRRWVNTASLRLTVKMIRSTETFNAWKRKTWLTIQAAALARYNEAIARFQEERDRLRTTLWGFDTLSLRRLEREELLRVVMLWLIGPDEGYSNAPSWLATIIERILRNESDLYAGKPDPGDAPVFNGISRPGWWDALEFGKVVKFIQQAVEWENLLYIPYAYFWGSETQARDRFLFSHADPEHERFLRAGYARVVLPVRPGFEEQFMLFVETASLSGDLTPYITAAEETRNAALTNYRGLPPANPEKHVRPLLYPLQRQTWETMQTVVLAIEEYKRDKKEYPPTLASLAGGPFKDAWGRELVYKLPGSGNDYDLFSYGADGKEGGEDIDADISAGASASLIATWFDYSPTSGIDIVVDTKSDEIA